MQDDTASYVFQQMTPPDRASAIWPEAFPGLALEHAAVIETSLWMYHEPSAVRTDRIAADAPERVVEHDVVPIDTRMSTASGSLSSAVPATAEKGRLLTGWLVDRLVAVIDEEFPGSGGHPDRGADPGGQD
jgi:creatinine amidohydrolase